ncbi:hypothetical protein H9L19_02095 [Weissella diestrammenae]|uniref:Uncharacterized protein n=1 Tax=Weissella diestrammenae TaxID=1162633 RepID=A0A7G9T6G0_9LACO|nr:hypothetical protein [Weissella diestrammenae]MCM0583264.1 hypothetical protein [Weissella diestrammenae]QNN75685.1 hypothetical protein H9L19_02095 [Weissella diestrammenae]
MTTDYAFITQAELNKPADWQPSMAHQNIRKAIEVSISGRVSTIVQLVADFGYRTATINLHDLATFVREETMEDYQHDYRKHHELRDELIMVDNMPTSVFNTIVQLELDNILDASEFEHAYHTDGEVQIFWQQS